MKALRKADETMAVRPVIHCRRECHPFDMQALGLLFGCHTLVVSQTCRKYESRIKAKQAHEMCM
jgi:hypothetical protein